MTYRFGKVEDWPGIAEFIASTKYFPPVDPSTLGGRWLIALRNGKVVGTIWCFMEKPHAYIDYWASSYSRVAAHLGGLLEGALRHNDIMYVRGHIASCNTKAVRLATEGLGMVGASDYTIVHKGLWNG